MKGDEMRMKKNKQLEKALSLKSDFLVWWRSWNLTQKIFVVVLCFIVVQIPPQLECGENTGKK